MSRFKKYHLAACDRDLHPTLKVRIRVSLCGRRDVANVKSGTLHKYGKAACRFCLARERKEETSCTASS